MGVHWLEKECCQVRPTVEENIFIVILILFVSPAKIQLENAVLNGHCVDLNVQPVKKCISFQWNRWHAARATLVVLRN